MMGGQGVSGCGCSWRHGKVAVPTMDVMNAVRGRRQIKLFRPDPIDRERLLSLLDAAALAPNHRMVQPWEVVFIGPETRVQLNHKPNFGDAPVVFAVLSKAGETQLERDENVIATACFVQNFLLLAHAEGLGVRWASLGALPQNRRLLGVPDGYDVVGVFGVGVPREIPSPKPRTPIEEKIRELP